MLQAATKKKRISFFVGGKKYETETSRRLTGLQIKARVHGLGPVARPGSRRPRERPPTRNS